MRDLWALGPLDCRQTDGNGLPFAGKAPVTNCNVDPPPAQGCVSFLAMKIMFGFLLTVAPVAAQLSPGPLSRFHAELEGPTRCGSCHEFGVSTPTFKCTGCHEEIRTRLERGRGYHASVADASKEGRDCVACHAEHLGRDFELVYFPDGREDFNHYDTGYSLRGAHADLSCERCHNQENINAAELPSIRVKDHSRTLLGLRQDCLACHADEHRGQLGENCGACHADSIVSWQEPEWFDHATTEFPLTGRHQETACAECHSEIGGLEPYTKYTGIEFNTCGSCHRDPHGGAVSHDCWTCHTTSAWNHPEVSRKIDHAATDFPLNGRHAEIECNKCHAGSDFSRPIAHDRCSDCHEDAHDGQFLSRFDGGDCASCHSEEGFTPALFRLDDHQRTGFALVGEHAELDCEQCHEPDGPRTPYRMAHDSCTDCHLDPHEGEFEQTAASGRCEDCHTEERFRPSTFTSDRHDQTRFALLGSHLAIACVECHEDLLEPETTPITMIHRDVSCSSCHQDPHRSQFVVAADSGGPGFECTACHSERSWARLVGFDHAQTSFELVAAHQGVACLECHRSALPTGAVEGVVFADTPTDCVGCHEDVHAGQFDVGGDAYTCDVCHTNDNWNPTRFDHTVYSRFSLEGAHQEVGCGQCHTNRVDTNGIVVTQYRGTPNDCAGCHSGDPSGSPEETAYILHPNG